MQISRGVYNESSLFVFQFFHNRVKLTKKSHRGSCSLAGLKSLACDPLFAPVPFGFFCVGTPLLPLLQVLYFSESLVPTARKALCDPLEEVREAAAKTFEQLHSTIGHQALEDILPFLLKQLVSGSAAYLPT